MKNTINVYWSRLHTVKNRDLLDIKPSYLLKDLKKYHSSNSEFLSYLSCPASSNELSNTLCIKSDINFNFSFLDNKTFNENVMFRVFKDKWIDLKLDHLFFSDESLEISVLPAYFNNNELINNSILCSGRFNIGKWYRPFNPSYILKQNTFSIKRNDILYYIKFHTDKKINLIHYKFTPKLEDYLDSTLSLKKYLPKSSFKFIYNLFLEKKYNKRILDEIKANLTGY